jgi:hypothetical protein
MDEQKILNEEVKLYNYKRVHSVTGKIPFLKFQRVRKVRNDLFRNFYIPKP